MRSNIAIPALVIASLFGATTIASAQAEPTANEGTAHKAVKSSHMKPGTTTGMSTHTFTEKSKPGGQSTARQAPGN